MTNRDASIHDIRDYSGESATEPHSRRSHDRAERIPKATLAAVAKTLEAASRHGMTPTLEQVAGELGQAVNSGAFRIRMAACAHHGVIESGRGRVQITELGLALLDEVTRPAALVQMWLNIWVYNEIYTLLDGKHLPDTDVDFEDELLRIGVPRKRCPDVRRKLISGAETAGILTPGKDRLALPTLPPRPPSISSSSPEQSPATPPTTLPDSPATTALPARALDPGHTPISATLPPITPDHIPGATEVLWIDLGAAGGITIDLDVRWFALPAQLRNDIFSATDHLISLAQAIDGTPQRTDHDTETGHDVPGNDD